MRVLIALLAAGMVLAAAGCSSDAAEETHARSYVAEGLGTAETADESAGETADSPMEEAGGESGGSGDEGGSEEEPAGEGEAEGDPEDEEGDEAEPLDVCTFNIKFVGNYFDKENEHLADMLSAYDIVVVQELVAPPVDGVYPDGEVYTADIEAKEFSDAMEAEGFSMLLSEEDTGSGDIHKASSATEWWIAFYRADRVESAPDLPTGFLADDRSAHPVYRRVPYAFGFRTLDGAADFVLISVHLDPDDDEVRLGEFAAIAEWIDENEDTEKDFIILGDTNIQDEEELEACTPEGFVSMNSECCATNTKPDAPKPYDHVMYRPEHTDREIDTDYGLWVVDLLATMEPYWSDTYAEPYPGDVAAYDHNDFARHYSDHHPVEFRIAATGTDDD
jgi:hypothetical protein